MHGQAASPMANRAADGQAANGQEAALGDRPSHEHWHCGRGRGRCHAEAASARTRCGPLRLHSPPGQSTKRLRALHNAAAVRRRRW